jgi:radical SAM superfamily enzyme YgiQ (UPF0313 family)
MSSLLFTHSYFLRFDPKQWQAGQPYPPLGTLYAAAVMREQDHTTHLFDTMFESDPAAIAERIKLDQPDYVVIYDDGFNYLTKMCLTNMREAAWEMCRIAREHGCKVIVSSSDATDHYEQYLNAGADYVILGEGEMTLIELVDTLNAGNRQLQQVPGIVFRAGQSTIKTAPRPVMRNLDSLPLPAWDLIDIKPYREAWFKSSGYLSLNIGTTRGCPFKCNWCAKPIYGNRYNSRSPQHVVDELIYLRKHFQVEHIWFCDDIFGLKPGWVQEFASLVKQADLKIRFKIQSRADLLVQENYVAALAAAGCENVWMGAESGSQRVLDAMDKGITVAQIAEATALLKKHHIKPSFFIQFGYLGETEKDIRSTIRMINTLLPDSIGISVSYPLPGTGFYEKVKQDLAAKSNWTDSDELQLMFRNTFQPAFYKKLHRYVHKSHRRSLAIANWRQLVRQPWSLTKHSLKKAISIFYYFPAERLSAWQVYRLAKKMAA